MATSLKDYFKSPNIDSLEEAHSLEERYSDVGMLKPLITSSDVVVISEGWPSWSFSIQGLGFKRLKTKLWN